MPNPDLELNNPFGRPGQPSGLSQPSILNKWSGRTKQHQSQPQEQPVTRSPSPRRYSPRQSPRRHSRRHYYSSRSRSHSRRSRRRSRSSRSRRPHTSQASPKASQPKASPVVVPPVTLKELKELCQEMTRLFKITHDKIMTVHRDMLAETHKLKEVIQDTAREAKEARDAIQARTPNTPPPFWGYPISAMNEGSESVLREPAFEPLDILPSSRLPIRKDKSK